MRKNAIHVFEHEQLDVIIEQANLYVQKYKTFWRAENLKQGQMFHPKNNNDKMKHRGKRTKTRDSFWTEGISTATTKENKNKESKTKAEKERY